MQSKNKQGDLSKFLIDFLPLLAFVISFKIYGIIIASLVIVIATLLMITVNYLIYRFIPIIPLFSAGILTIFGLLTFLSNDSIFIKIKPTILNSLFGLTLLIGVYFKKPLIKYLLGSTISLNEKAWYNLSIRWSVFFFCIAIINEVVWRNFSEEFWVSFKLIGFLPITIIFTVSQIPFIMRNSISKN